MKRIRSAELRKMTPEERDRALSDALKATRQLPNGELKAIEDEIRGFEARRGMSSEQMRLALDHGRILETNEICQWLIALRLRDRLVSFTSRAE